MFCQFNILLIKLWLEKMTDLEDRVRSEVGKVQDPETGQTFEDFLFP